MTHKWDAPQSHLSDTIKTRRYVMQYKIRPSRFTGEWVVEAWEEEKPEGELYVAAFSGPLAEERAVD